MKKIFEIVPVSVEAGHCTLICEMSNEGFSFTIKDETENKFIALTVYHFDKSTPPVGFPIALQIIFHENKLLSEPFKKVIIVYSFPESVLIPFAQYDETQNENVLNLVYGDLQINEIILRDVVPGRSIYNVFRIPSSVFDVLQKQFPNAVSMHQYSVLLQENATDKNKLSLIFYGQKMVVSLIKNGGHQLINSFNYHSPQDVAYTVLNICQQFDVPGVDIEISGLLEKRSALFKEVYKYFETIDFAVLPQDKNYNEDILELPSHYFSHIFALDSCE